MHWRVCGFTVLLLTVHLHAAAGPIVFTSSGNITGSLLTPTGSNTFEEAQLPITGGWAISDGVSFGESFARGQWTTTAEEFSVSTAGLLAITLDLPEPGVAWGEMLMDFRLDFTLTAPMAYEALMFFHAAGGSMGAANGIFWLPDFSFGFTNTGASSRDTIGVLGVGTHSVIAQLQGTQTLNGFPREGPQPHEETLVGLQLQFTLTPVAVPEPGTLTLIGTGVVAASMKRRRRKPR